jgi:L-fuconate dehydratase
VYSLGVCLVRTDDEVTGTGFTLTLGAGNDLVARAIAIYGEALLGSDITEIMGRLGSWWAEQADHSQLRWLGPHKGVTHLALASVCGAVVDAWSRHRRAPLWRLLLDASPDELAAMIDPRAIHDVVGRDLERLVRPTDANAVDALTRDGYPGYDTSIGWLGYPKEVLVDKALAAAASGFDAVKLKIGSPSLADDVARVAAVRDAIGPDRLLMVDGNQCFDVPAAVEAGRALEGLDVFWFEEPVHADDLHGYRAVRDALPGLRIAGGEHLPNQVMFKTFLGSGAIDVAQPDIVRLGGLPELLGVALLAAHHGVPIAPHAGDMGQLHQHFAPFCALRLGHRRLPLEHIPHLREWFAEPATLSEGAYRLPTTPGSSTALVPDAFNQGTLVVAVGRVG